jgi:hypothetical protein
MGIILWLRATAPWFPNPADDPDDDKLGEKIASSLTHPAPAERLRDIARHVKRWSEVARDSAMSAPLLVNSQRLGVLADSMADRDMQLQVASQATPLNPWATSQLLHPPARMFAPTSTPPAL